MTRRMRNAHFSTQSDGLDPANLIVCPSCDAVFTVHVPDKGERSVCSRCHTVLIAPRKRAGMHIITVSLAVVILIFAAAVFPFMSIDAAGAHNQVSILDAALAFQGGPLFVVSLLTAAMILFDPHVADVTGDLRADAIGVRSPASAQRQGGLSGV